MTRMLCMPRIRHSAHAFATHTSCMQSKAFELHHSQMARSANPYATTLYYAQYLEDISKIDDAGETSDIPGWIRAIFVMERTFDEWNASLHQQLLLSQTRLERDFQARKLQEYRDSVTELQVRPCGHARPVATRALLSRAPL
jgi:hypothetical protein